jgi:hypothetical protein
MNGAIPPLPNTPSWRGAQLKHRDNFTLTLPFNINCYPHACLLRDIEVFTGFWLGEPKVRDHWEDLGVGGRTTLRWTLGR